MKPLTAIRLIFLLFIHLQFSYSFSQNHSLNATISGLNNDTLLITSIDITKPFKYEKLSNYLTTYDTIVAANNSFWFNNTTKHPLLVEITPINGYKRKNGNNITLDSKNIKVLLIPDSTITITGNLTKLGLTYTTNGTKFNKDYLVLKSILMPNLTQFASNYIELDSLRFYKTDTLRQKQIKALNDSLYAERRQLVTNFVYEHLNSNLSVYLATSYGLIAKTYDKFTPNITNGMFNPFIIHAQKAYERYVAKQREKAKGTIKIGNKAPDFSLKDNNNTNVNLYNSNKEFIVIDFWGSWCAPCVKGFPQMKKYYSKYKKRIDFISIACNDSNDKWQNALQKYTPKWTQLLNGNRTEDVSILYAIEAYPTKIIINRNKEIIGIYTGESDDFYKKLDNLMQ